MPRSTPPDLAEAFERAARARRSDGPSLADPRAARARRILDARFEAQEAERCPTPTLRRVQGLFSSRPRSLAARVLALVFDSGVSPLPAMRGAARSPRTLRYAGGGATVDLQIREASPGRRVLHLAADPALPGGEVEVRALPRGAARRARLDGAGTGDVPLPARARRVRVTIRHLGAGPLRIGSLRLV